MKNDFIEKGKWNVGDQKMFHGTLHYVKELKPDGSPKWARVKGSKGTSNDVSSVSSNTTPSKPSIPSKPTAAQIANVKAKSGKMDTADLAEWASKTSEANLLKIVNNPNGKANMRKVAYDELVGRGYDKSKIDTSGTLDSLIKMLGSGGNSSNDNVTPTNSQATIDINAFSGGGSDDDEIMEKWYLDKSDPRVKKMFNLNTKGGRIKYDKFVYKMKIKEPDYQNPKEVMDDLSEQYYEFLSNKKQRFMISAGGAGIGKSYQFNKIAEILNFRDFTPVKPDGSQGNSPGDEDYDIFEAPQVQSGKQLLKILKTHNGKIIKFDDNDNVLFRADCSAVMKKATATNGRRILGDADDVTTNFEFTGKIVVMTNKDLVQLSENSDTKAIISRAMMVNDIQMTVHETIEVMKKRIYDYDFEAAPHLPDKKDDEKERKDILDVIEKNENNIDPATFTTRTFERMILAKRRIEHANEGRKNPELAKHMGSKMKDWKVEVLKELMKAENPEFGFIDTKNEILKSNNNSRAFDDGVDYEVDDEEPSLEKAESMLLFDNDDKIAMSGEMSLSEAESLLLN
jgi:hypothetical protein